MSELTEIQMKITKLENRLINLEESINKTLDNLDVEINTISTALDNLAIEQKGAHNVRTN